MDGLPHSLVQTKIDVKPYDQVDEAFAASEGEGDLSYEHWAFVHRRYFGRQCKAWGIAWRDDIALVCETFDLICEA